MNILSSRSIVQGYRGHGVGDFMPIDDLFDTLDDDFYVSSLTDKKFDSWIADQFDKNTDVSIIIDQNLDGGFQGVDAIQDKRGLFCMLRDMGIL